MPVNQLLEALVGEGAIVILLALIALQRYLSRSGNGVVLEGFIEDTAGPVAEDLVEKLQHTNDQLAFALNETRALYLRYKDALKDGITMEDVSMVNADIQSLKDQLRTGKD